MPSVKSQKESRSDFPTPRALAEKETLVEELIGKPSMTKELSQTQFAIQRECSHISQYRFERE